MLLPLMLLAGAQDNPVATMIERARAQTVAGIPCRTSDDDGEIVVCALREADRYRVPFVSAGSVQDSAPARTSALTQHHGRMACGQRAVIAQCGPGFGVSMTMRSDGSTRMVDRKPAP